MLSNLTKCLHYLSCINESQGNQLTESLPITQGTKNAKGHLYMSPGDQAAQWAGYRFTGELFSSLQNWSLHQGWVSL